MGSSGSSGSGVGSAIARRIVGKKFDPYAPPTVDAEAQGVLARDRLRRLTQRALGRDSTVRTSFAGAMYDGSPKKLLGS